METPPKVVSAFAGRYAIDREIGQGATAIVYLARDAVAVAPVAIKVFRSELTTVVGAERFLREVQVTQALQHPHIAPVLDSGEFDGQLYLVLPYLEGGNLRARLERDRQLPIDEALRIAGTIANALDHAHGQGIIHRDVKPENILFSAGQAYLADFGIARAVERAFDESTTSTGLVRGTPAYMSPEQASGNRNYDGRSDIYSLACVLYEMVAGMPAFVGPTPEAIIAQRFSHAPRDVRVYRPTAPEALVDAMNKGLERIPADRFQSARDFETALSAAGTSSSGAARQRLRWSRPRILASVLPVVAAVTVFGIWRAGADSVSPSVVADTTQYVIFPFERDAGATEPEHEEQLMRASLLRWSGVSVVDDSRIREALGGRSPSRLTTGEAQRIAHSLGSGRYVQARLVRDGPGVRLNARLYDATNGKLAEVDERVDPAARDSSVAKVIDRLLFRGPVLIRRVEPGIGTSSLPARQAYLAGHASLEQWSLARADSSFELATQLDPRYAQAFVWLALVRTWESARLPRWSFAAEAGSTGRDRLAPDDRPIADALVAMAKSDFPRACALWDTLTVRRPSDFAVWYAAGTCRTMDHVVERDRAQPSGWRFRSSYHTALLQFKRAFQLQPAILKALRENAFEKVRKLLKTSQNDLRIGNPAPPDTTTFFAYSSLDADTLVFAPIPASAFRAADAGRVPIVPATLRAAVRKERVFFRDIATTWAAAYPHDAEPLEALAVALQLLGDRSALDTLARARGLAADPDERFRIGVSEAWMRIKFSVPDDIPGLRRAKSLADSLLTVSPRGSADAEALASLAVVTGRAVTGVRFSRSVQDKWFAEAPPTLNALRPIEIYAALGGPVDSLRALEQRAESTILAVIPPEEQRGVRAHVFERAAGLAFPHHQFAALRSRQVSGNYLFDLFATWIRGDTLSVLQTFNSLERSRNSAAASELTLDAIYPEAWLIAQTGDVAKAVRWLDAPLGALAQTSPGEFVDPVRAGVLVRALALRAEFAERLGDHAQAARWAAAVAVLWSDADAFLQPTLQRAKQLSAR